MLLNIHVPSHSLSAEKVFWGPITGFEAPCGSGAAKPNLSRRENQNIEDTRPVLSAAIYLKLCQGGKHKAVNDGNVATQKVDFYCIPGRSAML